MRSNSGNISEKVVWRGQVTAIQPRTRVWRYTTHNRTHYHLGYNLFLEDNEGSDPTSFTVGISEKQQAKGLFRIGDRLQGTAWTPKYPNREFADYYRAGGLKVLVRTEEAKEVEPPPWIMPPPPLAVYEERGARILSRSRWKGKCFRCIWANMANVEIQWDFDRDIKRYRFETFCYGPKSCKFYAFGRTPTVPYRNMCSFPDSGALDEIITERRGEDD